MATKVYGQNQLPGDVVTVREGSTVAISLGFNATLGLVGNMDVSNGSATQGEVQHITDPTDALDNFGEGSELHQQIQMAFSNDVPDIYAIGVSETETTESITGSSTGTLSDAPLTNPEVCPEHTITVTDTSDGGSMTVNFVYGDDSPTAPGEPDTVAINPVTGEWTADSSSDYDFTFTHGDHESAIPKVLEKNIRFACVLTESEGIANTLLSELNSHAQNFDFMRGVVNGTPEVTASNYSDALDDQRICVVEPAFSFTDEAETERVRTCGPVASHLTSRPLSESATGVIHGQIDGLVSLGRDLTASGADWVDKNVLIVVPGTNIHIAKDLTTSTATNLGRVYAAEIADEVALTHHLIAEQFTGSFNYPERRDELETSLEVPLIDMSNDNPPLLENYTVSVTEGASDFEVDAEVGIDIVGVMDRINVNITVGDIVTLQGVN